MSRRWAIAALCLIGCGASEEDCQRACEQPYALVESEARLRSEAWQQIPGEPGEQAQAVYDEWLPRFSESREAWLDSCVEACRAHGTPRVIDCRRKAPNVGAWKRCGE